MSSPTHKHPTDRSLITWLIFSAISLALYPLFALTNISSELNAAASKRDGRNTLPGCLAFLLAPFTLGIFTFWWWHTTCDRIGEELRARDCGVSFGAKTYWGWGVFGILLAGWGPLIFIHKLCVAMNQLNEDYNRHGCTYPDPDSDGRRVPPQSLPAPCESSVPEQAPGEKGSDPAPAEPETTPSAAPAPVDPPGPSPTPAAKTVSAPAPVRSRAPAPAHGPAPAPVRSPAPVHGPAPAADAGPAPSAAYAAIPISCPNGHENSPGARFCATCGAGLFQTCPECGWVQRATTVFCTQCGTEPKSFAAFHATLEEIASAAAGKDWASVQRLCASLPEATRLPGPRGGAMRRRAAEFAAAAEKAIAECGRLDAEASQAMDRGAFETAIPVLERSLALFPGRPGAKDRLDLAKRRFAEISEANAALLSALDAALAEGALDDPLSRAFAALPAGQRERCSSATLEQARERADRVRQAFSKFNAGMAAGRSGDADAALDELRGLSIPDSGLASLSSALETMRAACGRSCSEFDGLWHEPFRRLDFDAARNAARDAAVPATIADVRDHAETVRSWLVSEDSIVRRIENRLRAGDWGDALADIAALDGVHGLDRDDCASMSEKVRALRRKDRIAMLKGLCSMFGVFAAIATVAYGVHRHENAKNLGEMRLERARRLVEDIAGLDELLALSRARESNPESYEASLQAYIAGTNAMSRGWRQAQAACERLVSAKKSFVALAMESSVLAERDMVGSIRSALDERRWGDAAARAKGYLRLAEEWNRLNKGRFQSDRERLGNAKGFLREAAVRPFLEAAAAALAEADWHRAVKGARAAIRRDPRNAEANRILKEALSHFRPVAAFRYLFDGKPVDPGIFRRSGGGSAALPATLDLSPGTPRPAEFAVVTRDGATFVAACPSLSADWDGRREFDVSIRRSFAPGATRSIPLARPKPFEGTDPMVFRWCPPGWAALGCPDDEPGHRPDRLVRSITINGRHLPTDRRRHDREIEDGFWLAETEITQRQWESVMGSTLNDQTRKAIEEDGLAPKGTDPATQRGDENGSVPIYFVNFAEADAFCRRLTEIERGAGRLPAGFAYVLPTGDQWEHACRAGSDAALPHGRPFVVESDFRAPALDAIAWFGGNSFDGFEGRGWVSEETRGSHAPGDYSAPRRVGEKDANAWGLRDMLGNVWEWCADDAADQKDPVCAWGRYSRLFDEWSYHATSRPDRGWARMQRGGAWNSAARDVRPAAILWRTADTRSSDAGFRVALVRVDPAADWSSLPTAETNAAAARKAADAGDWQRCFDEATAALAVDSRNEDARALRAKALAHFRPVGEIVPLLDGRRVVGGFSYTLDGKPLGPSLRVKMSAGEEEDKRFAELAATSRGGLRYVAMVPTSGADWDGVRPVLADLEYRPEAGARRVVRLPGSGSPEMAFRWSGGATLPLLGSPSDEPGRTEAENLRRVFVNGFWMAETEVTQGQWRSVMGRNLVGQADLKLKDGAKYPVGGREVTPRESMNVPADARPETYCGDMDDLVPVYYVSWLEASEFCRRLTDSERRAGRLPDGFEYALPTEDQWECACRAGSGVDVLPNGAKIDLRGANNLPGLDPIAWYGGNSSQEYAGTGWSTAEWKEKQYPGGLAGPHAVKGKAPNAWGLYDMLGNVREWCADESGRTDPDQRRTGRALRGGSWLSDARWTRPAAREWNCAGWRSNDVGFRVALVQTTDRPRWNDFAQTAEARALSEIRTAEAPAEE